MKGSIFFVCPWMQNSIGLAMWDSIYCSVSETEYGILCTIGDRSCGNQNTESSLNTSCAPCYNFCHSNPDSTIILHVCVHPKLCSGINLALILGCPAL